MPLFSFPSRETGILSRIGKFGYNIANKSRRKRRLSQGGKLSDNDKFQFHPTVPPAAEKKGSRWGCASIALAVVTIVLYVAALVLPSLEDMEAVPVL
jgi:hypothetical protein